MLALDGPIQITSAAAKRDQIENNSKMDLHSVCVVERVGSELEGRWIGDLLPGQSIPLTTSHLPADKRPFADERSKEASTAQRDRLNLEQMFRLALDPKNIDDGETRLVARFDEVLPGEAITPSASQVRGATLVVAHLRYAPLATARKRRQHPPRNQSHRRPSRRRPTHRVLTKTLASRHAESPDLRTLHPPP